MVPCPIPLVGDGRERKWRWRSDGAEILKQKQKQKSRNNTPLCVGAGSGIGTNYSPPRYQPCNWLITGPRYFRRRYLGGARGRWADGLVNLQLLELDRIPFPAPVSLLF